MTDAIPDDAMPSTDLLERIATIRRRDQLKDKAPSSTTMRMTPGAIVGDMRFPLIDASELLDHIEPPEYIADGLIERGVTCGLIGPPESGKSLFAQHMPACVSTGQPFFGRHVTHGLVVYLAGEGYHGIARRLQAIEAHHKLGLADAAFVVSKCGASFLSPMEVARIQAAIGLRNLGYLVGTVGGSYLPHVRPNDRNTTESAHSDGTQATESARASLEACISDASSVAAEYRKAARGE
jgi:hypothetical protein